MPQTRSSNLVLLALCLAPACGDTPLMGEGGETGEGGLPGATEMVINHCLLGSVDGEPAANCSGGCQTIQKGEDAGGGGLNPEYLENFEMVDDHLSWEWWVAPEEEVNDPFYEGVNPETAELAASLDASWEFFADGGIGTTEFSNHLGVDYQVWTWASSNCEDAEPPPGVGPQ